MKLKKLLSLLLGLVTLWPLIHIALMISLVFIATPDSTTDSVLDTMFAVRFLTIVIHFALLIFYITYLFKYAQIKQESKILWALLFIFGGFITLPVFWYLYLWRELDKNFDLNLATSTNQDGLICHKCSNIVSDRWKVCPHCGEYLVEKLG